MSLRNRFLPSSRPATWLIALIVVLAFVLLLDTGLNQFPPAQQFAISETVGAILLVGTAAYMLISLLVAVRQRQTDMVLIDLGYHNRTSIWPLLIISLALGINALMRRSSGDSQGLGLIAVVIYVVTFVIVVTVEGRLPNIATNKGLYLVGLVVRWNRIKSYNWRDKNEELAVLSLEVTHRWQIFNPMTLQIPLIHKEAVDRLLFQHGAAQPGVQPTRPAAEVRRQF